VGFNFIQTVVINGYRLHCERLVLDGGLAFYKVDKFCDRQTDICEAQACDMFFHFTFMLLCIVIHFFLITNQMHQLFKFILL